MRWRGHATGIGKKKNSYMFPVGEPEGKRLLGRPTIRWAVNIIMDLSDIDWENVD
jgi:hypothetical protein